jgi:hypothetical protein
MLATALRVNYCEMCCRCWTEAAQTSENAVGAKFVLPHRPGPEGLAYEGPQHDRRVLSVSFVKRATKGPVSTHKKPLGMRPGPSRSCNQVLGGARCGGGGSGGKEASAPPSFRPQKDPSRSQ